MKILAFDTAGEACSVALAAGERIFERIEFSPRRHAATLLPMAQACLDEAGLRLADLDALAFGRGPGSFTGLRIAAGVTQGVAFGASLPVIPVSNLAAGAAATFQDHGWRRVLVAFDARMDEIYFGVFEIDGEGLPVLWGREMLGPPDVLGAPAVRGLCGAGSAFRQWPGLAVELGLDAVDGAVVPTARHLLGIAARAHRDGQGLPAEEALPVYLRDQVAWQGSRQGG